MKTQTNVGREVNAADAAGLLEQEQEQPGQMSVIERPDLALKEWGKREDVMAMAARLKQMSPGGNKMSWSCAYALAQYAIVTDSNPYRGEVYAYEDDRGKITIVDGYKLLVRWAKRNAPYTQEFVPMAQEELQGGAIGYRCYILRNDSKEMLASLITGGATWREALDLVRTSAVGIVSRQDMTQRNGSPKDPPTGWSWAQVAQKRALKNALNMSHGMPSPREIAEMAWEVGGVTTNASDWKQVADELGRAPQSIEEGEHTAAMIAGKREYDARKQAEEVGLTDAQVAAKVSAERKAASRRLYGEDSGLLEPPAGVQPMIVVDPDIKLTIEPVVEAEMQLEDEPEDAPDEPHLIDSDPKPAQVPDNVQAAMSVVTADGKKFGTLGIEQLQAIAGLSGNSIRVRAAKTLLDYLTREDVITA